MRVGVVGAALVLLPACTSSNGARPTPVVTGPPEIQHELVLEHAAQFEEIGARPAGSQEELAASTYILGHLQQAGYVVSLNPVPVANLVRSTNLIASMPQSSETELVVAIPYDSASGPGDTQGLGLFLELARALAQRAPEHAVDFVALGAQSRDFAGSKALTGFYAGNEERPGIVLMKSGNGPVTIAGSLSDAILDAASIVGITVESGGVVSESIENEAVKDFFGTTDLEHAFVSGVWPDLGLVLLEFLAQEAS